MNIAEGSRTPAEVYEEMFVPALFRKWGPIMIDVAAIQPGDRVLDVACGTGVLACAAAEMAGPKGSVVGLDPNVDMLSVARRKNTRIEWSEGRAEALPFPDGSFDAVVSQFGLMFFDDRPAALSEMMRVLRSGGRLAVAVCDSLGHSPGYDTLAKLLQSLFGASVADAFRTPFNLGDPETLLQICHDAGIADAKVSSHIGSVEFASIASLISTERACVWTLGGMLDDGQFDDLLKASEQAFAPFISASGAVVFEMPALIITARKES